MLQHVIEEAKEMAASWRWANPDQPGSARVATLCERINSLSAYSEFRASAPGAYLVSLLEAYEIAMNDDWLPNEIVGLSLGAARQFIDQLAQELEAGSAESAINRLRGLYSQLAQP